MWAKNREISIRQMYRLEVCELLALSSLGLPNTVARNAGTDGIFCILAGTVLALLFHKVLIVVEKGMEQTKCISFPEYLECFYGKYVGRILQAGYTIYFYLFACYMAFLFARLSLTNLLREESYHVVLAVALLLAFYCVVSGTEARARVFEILFWIILLPLFLMLFFAAGEVDTDYWTPVFRVKPMDIAEGTYGVFITFSIIFFSLFLKKEGKKGCVRMCSGKAIGVAGGICGGLYLILQGLFGAKALSFMEFPIVTLMSRVQMTGGFLKRTDAFMFGLWFFALLAVLCGVISYGRQTLARFLEIKRGQNILALCLSVGIFFGADLFYRKEEAVTIFEGLLWFVGTPYVVGVPGVMAIVLWIRQGMENKQMKKMKKYWKRMVAGSKMLLLMVSVLTLAGCKNAELEDREFPRILLVKQEDDFCKSWMNARYEGNLMVDYNHLKVILIERETFENQDFMEEMLAVLEREQDVPENTYVVLAENLESMKEMAQGLEEELGTYIEEMMENVTYINKDAYPTLGMLFQEEKNEMLTLFVPCMEVYEENLSITGYEVYKRGKAAGMVDTDTALLSFFVNNQLEEYPVMLGEETLVTLKNENNTFEFAEVRKQSGLTERQVEVVVKCDGEIFYDASGRKGKERENSLNQQLEAYFKRISTDALAQGVDITNGYKKIGGYQREWLSEYEKKPDAYERDLGISFDLQVNWFETE